MLKGLVPRRSTTSATEAVPATAKTNAAKLRAERGDGAPASVPSAAGAPVQPAPKGRPTPTRRAAEAARRTSVIGGSSTARGGRAGREDAASRRAAMRRGDNRVLSARDRGPVRAFVRDYVDGRRNVIGLFIYIGIPCIALAYSRVGVLTLLGLVLLYAFVVAAIVDFVLMVRGLGRAVAVRFPDEPRKNLGRYAMLRAMQLRRSRSPAPRVERGTRVA